MAGTVLNPTSISQFDGSTNLSDSLGKAGEQYVTELHGKYYTQAYRGTMFWAGTVAATATAIYTATAVTSMGIWNPQGSGKNIVLARTIVGPVTAASAAVMIGYAIVQNAGNAVATAAPISSFTALSSSLRGGGLINNTGGQTASVALVCTGATVIAPTIFMPAFGMTTDVITTSSEGNAFYHDPDGMIIIQPGSAMFIASSAANTGTSNYGMYWYESPL